jgi:hypothetical protein
LHHSFVDSGGGGGGLSTIISVGESGDGSNSLDAGFSLESLLSDAIDGSLKDEATGGEVEGEDGSVADENSMLSAASGNSSPSRRRRQVGSTLDEREESSMASSKIEEGSEGERFPLIDAIPVPISKGFVLQPLPPQLTAQASEGDEGGGFGRDDPPWIGGDGDEANKEVKGGKADEKEDEGEKKKYAKEEKDGGKPLSPDSAQGRELMLNFASPLSPESPKDNVAIMVDGKEIGKVRESVVTGSLLQDLLEDEAKEKEKEKMEVEVEGLGFSLQGILHAEADEVVLEANSNEVDDAAMHDVEKVWPDRRPNLFFSLAKSQFISGEVAQALGSLKKCAEIAEQHKDATNNKSAVDTWAYKTLLANLANSLQRGSDSLNYQIDAPVEDVIDSYFPEDEEDEEDNPPLRHRRALTRSITATLRCHL